MGAAAATLLDQLPGITKSPGPNRDLYARQRYNNASPLLQVPEGFFLCPKARCDALVSDSQKQGKVGRCPNDHVIDWVYEQDRYNLNNGGITQVGLTNTAQGEIAEQVVWDLGDLGVFGLLVAKTSYHCPFDFITESGDLVEVRSASTRTLAHAFCPNADRKRRMNQYARAQGTKRQIGALVILDFVSQTAELYLKEMYRKKKIGDKTYKQSRAIYWEKKGEPFASGLEFAIPQRFAYETGLPDTVQPVGMPF